MNKRGEYREYIELCESLDDDSVEKLGVGLSSTPNLRSGGAWGWTPFVYTALSSRRRCQLSV